MDKKSLIAVGLSVIIWMGWQKFYLEPIQAQQQAYNEAKRAQEEASGVVAPSQAGTPGVAGATPFVAGAKTAPAAPAAVVKSQTLDNGHSRVTVSNANFVLSGWELTGFSKTLGADERVSLGDVTGFSPQLKVRFSDAGLTQALDQTWGTFEPKGAHAVESRIDTPSVKASRSFALDDSGYGGELHYSFHFTKDAPKFVFLDLYGSPKRATDKEGSIFGQAPDKVNVSYRDLEKRRTVIGAQLKENQETNVGVKWIGLNTRYFVLALVPGKETSNDLGAQIAHDQLGTEPAVRGTVAFPTLGKQDFEFSTRVYFGPKDMAQLTKVDPLLSDAIDFGWTSAIAIPLLQALKWLYIYVKNYGLAIILLTFLIKMALFPLMYKSMTSMAKMSKLQPQLNALREKYKDDKEKLNVEMMNFMKANGYNPIGGCLPILFQMPIFFALYRVLFNSMELYQAPFGLWIHDLSSPDPFYVTPVLLCGLMYLQQKLSPNTAADPAQQKMLQIMPVMFGAFMLMLPSGLTIYMVVNSSVSIAQQYFLNRKLGIVKAKPVVV